MILAMGCMGPGETGNPEPVLIRSGQQTVTRAQFERAFEAAWIAYTDDPAVDAKIVESARLRLLRQMTEELVADRRARELGIAIGDDELEAAIGEIKKDYPEGQFSQMLLESAIPYSLWRDRLRSRLLLEKVVQRDLVESVALSAQELEAFYETHAADFADDGDGSQSELSHHMIASLRREKVEAAYPQWMNSLQQRFGVEIDWRLWEKMQGSKNNKQRKASS